MVKQLTCPYCGYSWTYRGRGKNPHYVTCPGCLRKVKLEKDTLGKEASGKRETYYVLILLSTEGESDEEVSMKVRDYVVDYLTSIDEFTAQCIITAKASELDPIALNRLINALGRGK